MTGERTEKRVIIFGADGLRPDLVDPALMPTYAALMERGCLFPSFHSAYPTHTRVNMTTLTTGTLPGRHGVINNTMYVPGVGDSGVIDTADPKQLLGLERERGESVVLTPTLGDRLRKVGARLAVAASSTPGASLLWNPRNPQRVINPGSSYDDAGLAALHEKLGPPASESGRTKYNASRWATQALVDLLIDQPENRVITLWLTEPDASQHFYGLGSPEARTALTVVDNCLRSVLDALEARGVVDEYYLLLISDHGHSTVRHSGSLSEHLADARDLLDLGDLIAVGDAIYSRTGVVDGQRLARLTEWLLSRPWCGLVFSTIAGLLDTPGVLPLDLATGELTHDRAPLLVVNPTWSDEVNGFGVPGAVSTLTSYAPLKSTHGTASPYDMRAFCLGVGQGFEPGARIDVPCGTVDIAPTVWDALGFGRGAREEGFDGGSLLRLRADTPVRYESRFGGAGRDSVRIAFVSDRRYFLGTQRPAGQSTSHMLR